MPGKGVWPFFPEPSRTCLPYSVAHFGAVCSEPPRGPSPEGSMVPTLSPASPWQALTSWSLQHSRYPENLIFQDYKQPLEIYLSSEGLGPCANLMLCFRVSLHEFPSRERGLSPGILIHVPRPSPPRRPPGACEPSCGSADGALRGLSILALLQGARYRMLSLKCLLPRRQHQGTHFLTVKPMQGY